MSKVSSKISNDEKSYINLESQIRELIINDTGNDLLIKIQTSDYSNNSKLILIDVKKSDYQLDDTIGEISKVAENFFKKRVIIRVREYFDHS
jgi:hypothetical protein